MKCMSSKCLAISCLFFVLLTIIPEKRVNAQQYTDSITFRIDSAQIIGKQLEYSIMFWRTNKDWSSPTRPAQDTVISDLDLYFKMKDQVFDKTKQPLIVRQHAHLNGPDDFLNIWCRYHAGLFQIKLEQKTTVSAGMNLLEVPYNTPIELCKVQMPLKEDDRNPEFVWQEKSTGGRSNTGEPLIRTLQGDVYYNTDPSLKIEDYSKIEYVCEGGTLKLWARTYSTGTRQVVTWQMAKKADYVDAINFPDTIKGALVGEGQVHYSNTITTSHGEVDYLVSASNLSSGSRVDTLVIANAQQWMDSMYVQCILTDESLFVKPKKSGGDDTRIFLRDSIFAWFAASDPNKRADGSTGIGAHDRTDTIYKCPAAESYVSVFFFGPKCNEDINTIGSKMLITYAGRDQLANPLLNTVELTGWTKSAVTAPNGRCLYEGVVQLPDSVTDMKIWIDAISTDMGCDNGASYVKYDTVFITDVKDEDMKVNAHLADTTLAAGESMALNQKYPYTDYKLITSLGGKLDLTSNPKKYYAPTATCSDDGGCADTIIYCYELPSSKGNCSMEVAQVVNLSSWNYLNVKVLLEGALKTGEGPGVMSAYLGGMLPKEDGKYVSQYDTTKIYTLPTHPKGKRICDWIQICLRSKSNLSDACVFVDSLSVFLMTDGSIMTVEGDTCARFKNLTESEYYILARHHGHLIIMSANAVPVSKSLNNVSTWDATKPENVMGQNVKKVAGFGAMYVGDLNQDNIINTVDLNILMKSLTVNIDYYIQDLNFDTVINTNDKNMLTPNQNKSAIY